MDRGPPLINYRGSESDTDSDDTNDSYLEASGPQYAEFAKELMKRNEFYYPYASTLGAKELSIPTETPIPASAWQLHGNSKFETQRKEVTTLFMIDSKNRDLAAYPQPSQFTLRPPRVYKNVISIQIAQLKLLTSFYYFSKAKGNNILPVIERGRAITSYNGYPITKAITIADGTYAINELLTSLQTQMNYTPLFYDFPNGISDFITAFTKNGDLSVNFNQPGDTYYDSLNDKYIQNPTVSLIVSYYWANQYAGLTVYTLNQVKVAYYYPVLYELIVELSYTPSMLGTINLSLPPNLESLIQSSIQNYILFNSSGLNDPVILYIINENIAALDSYRLENTFRNYLINRYQLSYDTNSLRVNIYTTFLNTSLVNLFNLTTSKSYGSALSAYGISSNAYSNIATSLNQATTVFNDMYNYIQTQFVTYFAIGYGTYSSEYFLNTNNQVYIQYGLSASNVRSNINAAYLASGQVPISSYTNGYTDSPGYWPRFITENTGNGIMSGGPLGINMSTSMIPYSVNSSNFLYTSLVINPTTSYINTDKASGDVTCLATIEPARYSVFKFRSPVRQTLEVETLPLPYYYRFAEYNKKGLFSNILDPNGSNMPQKYFDIPYSFVYDSSGLNQNSLMDSLNYNPIYLTSSITFGYPLAQSLAQSPLQTFNTLKNYSQFEFIAPYPNDTSGTLAYATAMTFSSINGSWPEPVEAYVYHDRGAFMADIGIPRKENSNHYIQKATSISTSQINLQFSTFAGHTYYTILRSVNPKYAETTSFIPCVYYPVSSYVQVLQDDINFDPLANPYAQSNLTNYNFVTNYNTDFSRLPVASTLWGLDPTSSTFTNQVVLTELPIGYDINRVSNDLTDYCGFSTGISGFVPTTSLRIDPMSQYTFNSITPFNTELNTYFDINSSNALINTSTSQLYTFKGTSSTQIKIVHWYDGYSIPKQTTDQFLTSNAISSPLTSSISDYVKGFPGGSNGIEFGQGITAIGFLPTDGLYELSSFAFKSVLYPTNTISTTKEDPNMNIQYIGVYKGSYLATGVNRTLSSALTVLSYSKSVVYSPSTVNAGNNNGFGSNYGTWYEYGYDPSFVPSSNVKLSGYTQGPSELLSYTSMYYLVPFNSNAREITYSRLAGSLVPYPLSQVVSTGSNYFGQQVIQPPGVSSQINYLMPSTISNANPAFGPQGLTAYTQSQYEQSQPITTTSLGYQSNGVLSRDDQALFNFAVTFSNTYSTISRDNVGLTTWFTEYNSNVYLGNSLSTMSSFSNSGLSFKGAEYASSISTLILERNGSPACIHYLLLNTRSTLQNYTETKLLPNAIMSSHQEPFVQYELNLSSVNTTVWMWGGGGHASPNSFGGAGAYVKANLDVQSLYSSYQISTVYLAVGQGGDTQGGSSGIYLTSTMSSPILVVGGGGAGIDGMLGGPGGFGVIPKSHAIEVCNSFSTLELTTIAYNTLPYLTTTVSELNSNTYGVEIQYDLLNLSSTLGKLRLSLESVPTHITVYSSKNKAELLYSSRSTILSQSNEISITGYSTKEIIRNGYILGDKYSLDDETSSQNRMNWAPNGLLRGVDAIVYVESFSRWYMCSEGAVQESSDGFTWSLVYAGSYISLTWNSKYETLVACDSNGILYTTDGSTWFSSLLNIPSNVERLYAIDGSMVATSSHGLYICSEANHNSGFAAVPGFFMRQTYSIAYGANTYVVAQASLAPLNSGLVYTNTMNGSWYAAIKTNLAGFRPISLAYGKGVFVAGGMLEENEGSSLKYSKNGIHWFNSHSLINERIHDVRFISATQTFIALGTSMTFMSKDGYTWTYDGSVYGSAVAYGPLRILPNLSSIYMEVKSPEYLQINEIQTLEGPFITKYQDILHEVITQGLSSYSVTLNYSTLTRLNSLEIYTPVPYFSGVSVENIAAVVTSNGSLYRASLDTPLTLSSFHVEFTNPFPGIYVSDLRGLYDPSLDTSIRYAAHGYSAARSGRAMTRCHNNSRELGSGGTGYFMDSHVTLIDYAMASPEINYLAPRISEQAILTSSLPVRPYGQGGAGGPGQNGFIQIQPYLTTTIVPTNNATAKPSFVDGSKLSLFQAAIPTGNTRVMNFVSYTDLIQTNYVWYNSYLSLVGSKLDPISLVPISGPNETITTYPNLPGVVYQVLANGFNTVSTFFVQSNYSVSTTISETVALAFDIYKSKFVEVSYTSPSYVEMTEIYCLLDYLSKPENLVNPHVNSNSPIDRIFGGIPRFGYWANPFLVNTSYIGYDIQKSLAATSPLAAITGSSNPVTAMYGLVLEQNLSSGIYELKDIMAYKPTVLDASGTNWLIATQFTESYIVRSLTNDVASSNIPVQPYTLKNAIQGSLPLFNYSVYSVQDTPIHVINDFEGCQIYFYTFQNYAQDNVSSIHLLKTPFTSTMIQMNQTSITDQEVYQAPSLGTVVSQNNASTITQIVTSLSLDATFRPTISYSSGLSNFYNDYTVNSKLSSQVIGKAITDYTGSLYATASTSKTLYQNVCSIKVYMTPFTKENLVYKSPRSILATYQMNNTNSYYDFFQSKYTNIWHLQGTQNLSTMYGARLQSNIYDYTVTTNFVNQIFYPTHKLIMTQKGAPANPIVNAIDLITYPSYTRTEMFYYKNYSSLMNDIGGKFALEKTSNFTNMDTNSGYFLNSYINNINLSKSPSDLNDSNSYSYLAIRAYSPSERFNTLVRFYLSNRYDFGYISLKDLSSEISSLQTESIANMNPLYFNTLSKFTSSFIFSQTFGASGLAGFSGSNIVAKGFGDFLQQYSSIYGTVQSNSPIVTSVNTAILNAQTNLINGDLRYILPSSVATRQRVTDPLEFSLPFSSINTLNTSGCGESAVNVSQYGIGYNLGYEHLDTPFNTIQRAGSFFKILDDYIYMKLNPEYNMNRLDISRQEDFASTRESVAESQMYNCKLLLNTFGTYSTTFVQNPVLLNPPIGKLDKLSFSWYNINGNLIDNNECDWSATLQIVERLDIVTDDSTAPRPSSS